MSLMKFRLVFFYENFEKDSLSVHLTELLPPIL